MPSAPLVSVTICMRNGGRYIHEALNSVFNQTLQDFEIVLVDDGSTDGSPEAVIRDFPDPRLRVIRQHGQTLRVARPVALAHCRGQYITFIDHDDVWLPHKLEAQVALAMAHPTVGLICSECLVIDADGRVTGRLFEGRDVGGLDLTAPLGHLALLRLGNFVAYPSAFIRARAARAVGGFSREYQYVSDYDLWLRIARRHDLMFVTDPLAKYRVHGSQMTQRSREITVTEHGTLFGHIISTASYPPDVRNAVADHLFGQRRLAATALWTQGKRLDATISALSFCATPLRLQYYVRHRLRGTFPGFAARSACGRNQGSGGHSGCGSARREVVVPASRPTGNRASSVVAFDGHRCEARQNVHAGTARLD